LDIRHGMLRRSAPLRKRARMANKVYPDAKSALEGMTSTA
jgi:hypothetical protein